MAVAGGIVAVHWESEQAGPNTRRPMLPLERTTTQDTTVREQQPTPASGLQPPLRPLRSRQLYNAVGWVATLKLHNLGFKPLLTQYLDKTYKQIMTNTNKYTWHPQSQKMWYPSVKLPGYISMAHLVFIEHYATIITNQLHP